MVVQLILIVYSFAFIYLPCYSLSLLNRVPSGISLPGYSSYSNSMTDNLIMCTKSPYGYGNYNSKYQTKLFAKKQSTQKAPTKKNSGEMVRVSDTEELNRKAEAYKVQLSDSFNSTTFKILLGWKEEIESVLLKIEKQISSWSLQISLKVQRDIRTTLAAGDFISRQASKSVEAVVSGVEDIQRPLSSLPERVKDVVTRSDSWDLLGQGIDPTEKSSLISTFDSATTKQRAEKIKKKRMALPDVKVPGVGIADSLYRSVRLLPSKLQYDYQRRQVQRELAGAGKGAGGIARALPGEAVSAPVSPSAVVAVPAALSDGNDYSTWQQNEEELDGQEGLDDLRVIQVVDEDGRVTTLKAASFDMASSAEFDDDDEEEEVMMLSPAATLVEDLSSAVAAVYRLTDGRAAWTDLPMNSWVKGESDVSAIAWLRSLLVDAKAVVSQCGAAKASARRVGDAEFSSGLQQLNATLTQIEGAVLSCDRLSSLGASVGLSAVEADILHEADLSEEDITLTLNAICAVERIAASIEGEESRGVLDGDFLRQMQLLESVSVSANGTVARARLVELTGVLQEIQKGLTLERDRTLTAQLDSSVQDHAVIEPDHVESEQIEANPATKQTTSEQTIWSPGALLKTPPAPPQQPDMQAPQSTAAAPTAPAVFKLDALLLREAFDLCTTTYQLREERKRMEKKVKKKAVDAVAAGDGDATLTEEAVVVETTAVLTETKEAKFIGFLITSLDVTLFLLESLLKAVVPILKDGGSLALSRASETIEGWGAIDALTPSFRFPFKSASSKWKIYEQFKNSEIYYAKE